MPNLLTLLNLLCALPAIESALAYNFYETAFWLGLSLVFDFLDGFAARALGCTSPLGAQLDSLADVVSFGVVPSLVLYKVLQTYIPPEIPELNLLSYLAFGIAGGAAFRLGRFNLDASQTSDFKGLPTPSMAIFVLGIPFFIEKNGREVLNLQLLALLPIVLIWTMNSNIRLFALKFKKMDHYLWLKAIFLLLSALSLFFWKLAALSFVILLYVFLSLVFYRPIKIKENEISS
ncbi:CDP-alcohol phosphatidyltransferase family protein [Thermaurantimonas aggregans]|uniref:CDP-alcohol phosphatidyltransferase family protein n=1 Tax=Thermaurantimonas aggregans TaxID=2173829 RepID=UPI0023F08F16|nr:CDP-alcohol phosphatidyltransferase family protein [Thermaurantimonas aggregans]